MKRFFEQPMSTEEIDQHVKKIMEERARHDAELQKKFNLAPIILPVIEKPLSTEEINVRVQRVVEERAKQDAELHRKYASYSSRVNTL